MVRILNIKTLIKKYGFTNQHDLVLLRKDKKKVCYQCQNKMKKGELVNIQINKYGREWIAHYSCFVNGFNGAVAFIKGYHKKVKDVCVKNKRLRKIICAEIL